jgi:hypothetical protein
MDRASILPRYIVSGPGSCYMMSGEPPVSGALYQVLMIMTHRDVFSELSARSLIRGDAGHRKGRATRSESSEKTQSLSPLGRVG